MQRKGVNPMFFKNNQLQFYIKDVFLVHRENTTIQNTRPYSSCLSYRLDGESYFDYGNNPIHVKTGDIIFVPAHTNYHYRTENEEIIIVHLELSQKNDYAFSLVHMPNPETSQKFKQLFDTWNSRCPGYQFRSNSILYDILADVRQQNYAQSEQIGKAKKQISASIEYLYENYYKSDLNIKSIAAASNISEVYFRKRFQQIYHTSPLKYINHLRITKAKTLLKEDSYTIKSISLTVGFSDPLYFSRIFKSVTGLSPLEYRLQARMKNV